LAEALEASGALAGHHLLPADPDGTTLEMQARAVAAIERRLALPGWEELLPHGATGSHWDRCALLTKAQAG